MQRVAGGTLAEAVEALHVPLREGAIMSRYRGGPELDPERWCLAMIYDDGLRLPCWHDGGIAAGGEVNSLEGCGVFSLAPHAIRGDSALIFVGIEP